MDFYEKYLYLCQETGRSPSYVANAIGLNNSSVTGWKHGSQPKAETVKRLSEYFGVSVDYLIGLTNDPYAPPRADETRESANEANPTSGKRDRNLVIRFGDYYHISEIRAGTGDKIIVTYDFRDKGLNMVEFNKLLNIIVRMAERYDITVNDIFEIVKLTDKTMSNVVRYLKIVRGDNPVTDKMPDIVPSETEADKEGQ